MGSLRSNVYSLIVMLISMAVVSSSSFADSCDEHSEEKTETHSKGTKCRYVCLDLYDLKSLFMDQKY